jgi:hypothetical protein
MNIKDSKKRYNFIEVSMPRDCVWRHGAVCLFRFGWKKKRLGLYENNKIMKLYKPQDNPCTQKMYLY